MNRVFSAYAEEVNQGLNRRYLFCMSYNLNCSRQLRSSMFPAHAGMNRASGQRRPCGRDVPRTRGDEPDARSRSSSSAAMFPAHAGMNRRLRLGQVDGTNVPRTRGDEPPIAIKYFGDRECSPHTRG